MSLQFRIADQVLRLDDSRDATEGLVHRYDAFLNLLCADRYAFQRDAVRSAWCFLVSDKYPSLDRLARENWNVRETIRQRHDNQIDAYLAKMPLKDCKAVSLDLATGTGKSFVMYALAAMALAEGLVDRVWVSAVPNHRRRVAPEVFPAHCQQRISGHHERTGRGGNYSGDQTRE